MRDNVLYCVVSYRIARTLRLHRDKAKQSQYASRQPHNDPWIGQVIDFVSEGNLSPLLEEAKEEVEQQQVVTEQTRT